MKVAGPSTSRRVDLQTLVAYGAGRLISITAFAFSGRVGRGFGLTDAVGAWDGSYYVNIAAHGYPTAIPHTSHGPVPLTAAFFPLYPVTIAVLHGATGFGTTFLGATISVLCGAAAALVFVRIARSYFDDAVAARAGILFGVFPGSVVLSLVYAEGLLLLLSASCLLALRKRRWVGAATFGILATATRPIAIALVLAALWVAFRDEHGRQRVSALITAAAIPLGAAMYLSYLWVHTGRLETWFRVERLGWDQHLDFGVGFGTILRHPHYVTDPVWMMYLIGFAVLVALLAPLARGARLPGLLGAYVTGVVLQCLLDSGVGPRLRFLFTAFPLLLLPASAWSRRTFRFGVGASCVALALVSALYVRPGFTSP
jgi:hypothetical protein